MKSESLWFVFAKDLNVPLSAMRCGNRKVLFNDYPDTSINGFKTRAAAERSIKQTLDYAKEENCKWTREDYEIIEVRA
jgi:hypothetical protein